MRDIYNYQQPRKTKSHTIAILLSIFLGSLGLDRLYLGHFGVFILKLLVAVLSLGTIGTLWWIIDIVLIATKKVDSSNFRWR